MVVTVLQHVTHASTYDDGDVIFRLIEPELRSGRPVTLSFAGLSAVPSSFINSAIIRLVESVPVHAIRSLLRITDSTRQINDLIRGRLEFVASSGGPRATVSLREEWEVVYWARVLGVTPERLADAVKEIGPDVSALRKHFADHGSS